MKEIEIPDLNLFMLCENVNNNAYSNLQKDYYIRLCRKDELEVWKKFPFDTEKEKKEYMNFMTDYFNNTYISKKESFFEKCLFVCNSDDKPIATCFSWKAYEEITTIHWFKTLKSCEGKGIGRALLTEVMKNISLDEYPVLLHTQPSSFRAIKLYSDFGFKIIVNDNIGIRINNYKECLPILKQFMTNETYQKLEFCEAPKALLKKLENHTNFEF